MEPFAVILSGASVKPKLLPGDIGFLMHHDNWISKGFAWVMGSKWSHSFLIQETTEMRTYTSETSDFHVMIGTLDKYLGDKNVTMEIWRCPWLSDEMRLKIAKEAVDRTFGDTYGYFQVISLGIRIAFRHLKLRIKNWIKRGTVCCGHVMTGYHYAKIPGWEFDPESIDTEEMYKLVKHYEFKMILQKQKGELL